MNCCKKVFLLVFLSVGTHSFSQDQHKKDVVFSPGILVQKALFFEANLLVGDVTVDTQSKIPMVGAEGWRIGIESNLQNNTNFVIAPKIGYEISPLFYTLRFSVVNYFQDGNSEFRLLPELGYSLGGWINLTYGYGISVNNGNLRDVSRHRVSLTFNLNKRLRKGVFELF